MRLPASTPALVLAVAIAVTAAACGDNSKGVATVPPLDLSRAAGPWLFANTAGDTVSLTIAVNDTVITGSGWVTNSDLRTYFGGSSVHVPVVLSGWGSPTRYLMHADLAIDPAATSWAAIASIFTGQLDARFQDFSHMRATLAILVNGSPYWSATDTVPMTRTGGR